MAVRAVLVDLMAVFVNASIMAEVVSLLTGPISDPCASLAIALTAAAWCEH